jgi:hypothetical protein
MSLLEPYGQPDAGIDDHTKLAFLLLQVHA